ncbi:unnamed protein product [Discula destructiva]
MASPLAAYLKSLKTRPVDASIESLAALFRRRQLNDPEQCAIATANLLLHVVAKSKWTSVDHLLHRVHDVGKTLVLARPKELVIGNIVRRVMCLIRTEAEEDRAGNGDDSISELSTLHGDEPQHPSPLDASQPGSAGVSPSPRPPPRLLTLTSTGSFHVPKSMFNMLNDPPSAMASLVGSPFARDSGSSTPMTNTQVANVSALREEVLDGISELKDEIASADDQIKEYAEVQILPGSTVLVYKPNSTVEKFLLFAAKKRKFSVLIAGFNSRKEVDEYKKGGFREQLSKLKVDSVVIAGNVTAHMSRVNTLVLNARGIAPCGAVAVDVGAASIARAAHSACKTVIVLGAVYKLAAQDIPELDSLVDLGGPSSMSKYGGMNGVNITILLTEVILPDLIDIYITNLGPHSRDHLQGIIGDHYKIEDVDITELE